MADDFYVRVAHGADVGFGVLYGGAGGVDGTVHAYDAVVEIRENLIGNIQTAVLVQDIGFCAIAQMDAEALWLA